MELVISDAHLGLKQAIATVFAGADWQRCRTHFMSNLLTRVPKRSQPDVAAMVRTIYQQLSPEEVHAQTDRVAAQLRKHFPQAAQMLEDALPDILAFTVFPGSHWQKLWSNNPLERLNKEIRRRRACPCRERGGNLSQPGRNSTAGRCGAGRAARRVGRGPSLPHLRRRPHYRDPAVQQHPGERCLININKDDAYPHHLAGRNPLISTWVRVSGRASTGPFKIAVAVIAPPTVISEKAGIQGPS